MASKGNATSMSFLRIVVTGDEVFFLSAAQEASALAGRLGEPCLNRPAATAYPDAIPGRLHPMS